jgi:hypothetical protein
MGNNLTINNFYAIWKLEGFRFCLFSLCKGKNIWKEVLINFMPFRLQVRIWGISTRLGLLHWVLLSPGLNYKY